MNIIKIRYLFSSASSDPGKGGKVKSFLASAVGGVAIWTPVVKNCLRNVLKSEMMRKNIHYTICLWSSKSNASTLYYCHLSPSIIFDGMCLNRNKVK